MNKHEQSDTEKTATEQQNTTAGAMLRQLRQAKGISIRDAAKATNISASNLEAIEHEHYAALPANTFIRGQVAIYANLLGADEAETARKFIAEREQHQQLNEQKCGRISSMSAKQLAEPAHVSAVTLAGGILLLIVLFIAGFCLYTGLNPLSFFLHREQGTADQLSPVPELNAAVSATTNIPVPTTAPTGGQAAPSGN